VLGGTHDLFIERVKSGRGERLDPEADVFSGLIYNGRQALQLGLIDGHLSPMEYALSELDTDRVLDFTPRKHPIEELTRHLGVEISTQLRQWVSGWVY
jgi:protease-4